MQQEQTATVETRSTGEVQEFNLTEAKERLAFLGEREIDLQGQSEKTAREEAAVLQEIDARQQALASGKAGVGDVVAMRRTLQEGQEIEVHLRLALKDVEGKADTLRAEITAEETRLERARQTQAASGLVADHEAALEAFLSGVVDLRDPLREAKAIRDRIAQEFPLVQLPEAPSLSGLIAALSSRLPDPDARQGLAIRLWLVALLKFPLAACQSRAGIIESRDLAALGIDPK